jgi:archaeosine-15-forming tRNA-guanine transglycosylase
VLSPLGCDHARHGRPVPLTEVVSGEPRESPSSPIALIEPGGQLIAIGRLEQESLRVQRGFQPMLKPITPDV